MRDRPGALMATKARTASEFRLVNGSEGDPVLFIDYPGRDDAILFDAGENGGLDQARLGDLGAVFITHHHVDHFIGLDRIVRANLDRDKTLHLFGPVGTIRKVYDRIKSYEYPFFPFQKLVIAAREVEPGLIRSASLECSRRFPEPQPVESPWEGPTIFEASGLRIEAAFADHTVPCLAFALIEDPGYHPDPERLAEGPLRPGPWVSQVLARIRSGESLDSIQTISGGRFTLGDLAEAYFSRSKGARVAYVTDTAMSPSVRPALLKLAHRADRLYCDSFYAGSEIKQAEKHRHMTSTQAAQFAREARVESLVLMHFATRYKGRYEGLIEEARAIFPSASAQLS
ncbi:MBL fold metallo-hydrolase [Tundrisphaera lichenicola]|uniref:MBL fold metallo-hydrolase n=1 Tax=Tundrisphaera lichenicola TaxID=2029860 RepID=UPI003EB71D99